MDNLFVLIHLIHFGVRVVKCLHNEKEKLNFDYSMKNIPATTERRYLLKLIEQTEMVIKRMRWKVINRGMKGSSIKQTPPINKLAPF